VLRARRGVCQDFAHLALAALRALRLPARYVSGYLLTRPPPGKPKLRGADASHAWISVWAPETGWVDFDPTNGMIPRNDHITVAIGRDYDDISPISGVLLGGGEQSMRVEVDVDPLALALD
jgi:transglutaminase-like putative cysteine protease